MTVIELGIYSGMLTIFLHYIIGRPGADFSPHEIFSGYTVWLSKRRLNRLGLLSEYQRQAGFDKPPKKFQVIERRHELHRVVFNAADPFFTWERAAGMCPVCTCVWIAAGTWLIFSKNLLDLLLIILISHIVTRLLNKIL